MKKINLFYYNANNFGDALSPALIQEFSDCNVVYKNIELSRKEKISTILTFSFDKMKDIIWPTQKVLGAVGSIMSWMPKGSLVWGTGFMSDSEYFKGSEVFAVRGQLTHMRLREQGLDGCDVYGDPALLLPLWLKPPQIKIYKLGIIPHWGEVDFFIEKFKHLYKIIDPRTKDIGFVVEEINKCEYILSSSLHGIIVAHAYNIPALWIKKGDIGSPGGFKFKDYFSSVDIPFYDGFEDLDEIFEDEKWVDLFNSNKDKININCSLRQIQHNLLKSAPFKLKEKYSNLL